MFKTDETVRFGQILSAIELLGMGNFNEYILSYLILSAVSCERHTINKVSTHRDMGRTDL